MHVTGPGKAAALISQCLLLHAYSHRMAKISFFFSSWFYYTTNIANKHHVFTPLFSFGWLFTYKQCLNTSELKTSYFIFCYDFVSPNMHNQQYTTMYFIGNVHDRTSCSITITHQLFKDNNFLMWKSLKPLLRDSWKIYGRKCNKFCFRQRCWPSPPP